MLSLVIQIGSLRVFSSLHLGSDGIENPKCNFENSESNAKSLQDLHANLTQVQPSICSVVCSPLAYIIS